MGGLGASYFKGSDDDTANDWIKIAALSNQVGENAEKADTATAYESLVGGKGIPEGMSDTVKINAKKMLADNMQGETVAAEQQIMADIAAKSKEQGVGIHDYLKGNVESYLTTPASYRAVGNISKMFQERQFTDASYQKAKMEEGELRYKEVSSLVQAADGLYAKGDLDGSKKMIEQISRIIPIPGFAKANEETGELEGYTTDFDKGGHKPAGMKFDVGGFLNAAKKVTRDEFAYGYALNSHVVNEKNAKNLSEASILKDRNGGRYMGFNFVNPYDATDTKYIVKQEGSGKTIAQFESIHEAVDSGYTPYNQKYEKGELDIANEKRQGRNLDLSARNLELSGKGLGLDNIYKRLRNDEQGVQTDIAINTRDDKIKYEKFKSLKEVSEASKAMYDVDKAADEKEQRELESRANLLEASLTGGGVFNGKKPKNASGDEDGAGVSYGIEEMKNAKAGVDRLVDIGIDRQLIPGMTQKAIKDSVKYTDNPDQYNKAFLTSLSVSTGMPFEKIQAYSDPKFKSLSYEDQEQYVQAAISKNKMAEEASKAEEFKTKGKKEISSVYEDIESRFNFYKKGQGYGSYKTDDERLQAAIGVYADDLAEIQEKYYKDLSPSEFIKNIKLNVAENINKKLKQASERSKAEQDVQKYKTGREQYISSLKRGGN